jgi:hypothetical protein
MELNRSFGLLCYCVGLVDLQVAAAFRKPTDRSLGNSPPWSLRQLRIISRNSWDKIILYEVLKKTLIYSRCCKEQVCNEKSALTHRLGVHYLTLTIQRRPQRNPPFRAGDQTMADFRIFHHWNIKEAFIVRSQLEVLSAVRRSSNDLRSYKHVIFKHLTNPWLLNIRPCSTKTRRFAFTSLGFYSQS